MAVLIRVMTFIHRLRRTARRGLPVALHTPLAGSTDMSTVDDVAWAGIS